MLQNVEIVQLKESCDCNIASKYRNALITMFYIVIFAKTVTLSRAKLHLTAFIQIVFTYYKDRSESYCLSKLTAHSFIVVNIYVHLVYTYLVSYNIRGPEFYICHILRLVYMSFDI